MKQEETRADGSLHFHYDRTERLDSRDSETTHRESFFRRNRGWLITLADIFLIILMFVIYRLFLVPHPDVHTVSGVEFRLETFLFDDQLFITIHVTRSEPEQPDADPVIDVVYPDGAMDRDVVPEGEGQTNTLRHVASAADVPLDADQPDVSVDISVFGERFVLRDRPE